MTNKEILANIQKGKEQIEKNEIENIKHMRPKGCYVHPDPEVVQRVNFFVHNHMGYWFDEDGNVMRHGGIHPHKVIGHCKGAPVVWRKRSKPVMFLEANSERFNED